MMDQCSLCEIADDKGRLKSYNRILFETKNFVFVPSIGPVNIGHFLIVSKQHTCGAASLNQSALDELFSLITFLSSRFPDGEILFFEHGGTDEYNQAGGCINHTHIHVLPGHAACYDIFDNTLSPIMDHLNKEQFGRIDSPYIMTLNGRNGFRVYDAHNAHSQMMRQAICAKQGQHNWDWRKVDQQEGIEKGINFWADMLQPLSLNDKTLLP